jgi:uncharacterized membrane protein YtjA (UPF0391 family)
MPLFAWSLFFLMLSFIMAINSYGRKPSTSMYVLKLLFYFFLVTSIVLLITSILHSGPLPQHEPMPAAYNHHKNPLFNLYCARPQF